MIKVKTTLLLFITALQLNAQNHKPHQHHGSGFRIAGIIGHTLINTEDANNVFIPSWGLDLEYWFDQTWGLGLHNDIEIETFIIRSSNNKEIKRVNPLVLTIDALFQFGGGFVITLGPGVELEKEASFYLVRVGFEYEKDINETLYLLPNFFLDQRFDGYNTWNIGLGIGVKL